MPLVSQTIKNLKGGISQQPDILRFPDQGKLQINGFSSEVQGLQKRPPSVFLKRLRDTLVNEKPLVKLINRDEVERYYVMYFPDGHIEVYTLEGERVFVDAPNGWGYTVTANPREDIRAVTVADYTFIVNRKAMVTESATVSHPGYKKDQQFMVSVKGGQYGRWYRIYVNGVKVAETETPAGNDPLHSKEISTQAITDKLGAALRASMGPNGWSIEIGASWIRGSHMTIPVESIKCEDGFSGINMIGIIFDVQRFNLLPAVGPDGYIVRVAGDPGSGADDYYIRFNAKEGLWKETIEPGVSVGVNDSSMPHVLVRQPSGTFQFRPAQWTQRSSGDDDSNPLPSCVGLGISDVFFFRNRLGLLSGENILLSGSGDFFNFFPKSVVASPDTDPIDVAVSHNRVSILNHAVPFAEELLLWSDQTQFVLRSDGVLSPRSVRVDQSTEFESTIAARPVAAGRSVYFAAPRATFTSIRRYYSVQDVSAVKNADDISAHIPSYIPNGVFSLGSSTTENVVTVLTRGAENRIYLYKYLYMEEQLVQQSWSHWEFGEEDRILACEFVGPMMYLLRSSPQGVFLERIEFTQNTKDFAGEPYRLYMDSKVVTDQVTYDELTNTSSVAFTGLYGHQGERGDYWMVRDDGLSFYVGEPDAGWAGKLTITGKHDGRRFVVGRAFMFAYEFSKFLIKVSDASGTRSEDVGRLQVRRGWVNYEQSGPFTVTVCEKWKYTMSGKRLGDTILGEPAVDTDQFRFPVMANAKDCMIRIESSDPTPVAIIGAGWSGMYFRREQPI